MQYNNNCCFAKDVHNLHDTVKRPLNSSANKYCCLLISPLEFKIAVLWKIEEKHHSMPFDLKRKITRYNFSRGHLLHHPPYSMINQIKLV